MEAYIILGILVLLAFSPRIAWEIYCRQRYSRNVKDFVSKPFVCPNCGHRFYTKQRVVTALIDDKAYLKCPNCKKRDVCGRPYDFDSEET